MHIIIKRPPDQFAQHQPKFWACESNKYSTSFSPYDHDYEGLDMANRLCPADGVVVSELSRHYHNRLHFVTYKKKHSRSANLIILRRQDEWVVYGSGFVPPVDISKVVLTSTEWTVRTIAEQVAAGNITINSVLKRRHNWGMTDKSKYIESLMLGLPVSQIVIAAGGGRFDHTVVDGHQRLLAIAQFYGFSIPDQAARWEEFALVDLDYRSDLVGLTRTQILADPELSQAAVDLNYQLLRVVRVTNWQKQSLLDNLSLRLNN